METSKPFSRATKPLFRFALFAFCLLAWSGFVFSPFVSGHALAQHGDAKRDAWQRPEQVMDALDVREGSHVADVGCGDGYFVFRLARRVGSAGQVYGVDIDKHALKKLRGRVERKGLSNVEIIHSDKDNTQLPPGMLDVVLIVNAYHEMREYDAMLRSIFAALKPGGRLAIIDAPGQAAADRAAHQREHTISEALVQEDALRNGFRFLRREEGFHRPDGGHQDWYFLIFEKPSG